MTRHELQAYPRGERAQLLTVNDVAARLVVHRDTVYNLVRRREIQPVKIGTRLRFRVADVERYIDRESP